MVLQEAMRHCKNKFPDRKIVAGYEYDSIFVFNAVPKDAKNGEEFFDSLVSVNKQSKKVLTFQPWDISKDEYNRGEKVI